MEQHKIYCILCGTHNDENAKTCTLCGKPLNQTEHPLLDYIKEKFVSYVKDTAKGEGENALINWLSRLLNSKLYGIALTLTLLASAGSILVGGGVRSTVTDFNSSAPIFSAPVYQDPVVNDLQSIVTTKNRISIWGRPNPNGDGYSLAVIRLYNSSDDFHKITIDGTVYSNDDVVADYLDLPYDPDQTVYYEYTDRSGSTTTGSLEFYPTGELYRDTINSSLGKNPDVLTYRKDGWFISQYLYDPNAVTGTGEDVYRLLEYDENNYNYKVSYYYFNDLHHYIVYEFVENGTKRTGYNADGSVQYYIEVLNDEEGRFVSDLKYDADGTLVEGDVYTYGADGSQASKTTYKNGRVWAVYTYSSEGTQVEYFN